nr:hypothetical protein CFP56_00687 [Quercus suber]
MEILYLRNRYSAARSNARGGSWAQGPRGIPKPQITQFPQLMSHSMSARCSQTCTSLHRSQPPSTSSWELIFVREDDPKGLATTQIYNGWRPSRSGATKKVMKPVVTGSLAS